jgi:N-acyl-D-aspartate/D-glutamate deacylase
MSCDWLLHGGEVVDGTGAHAFRADVAIGAGRIAAVGDLRGLEAARRIDCAGRTVAPGFIDIHSHADWLVPGRDHGALVEPFVRQGMTSIVAGNCGFSPAPVSEHNERAMRDASRLVADEEIELRWRSMGEFLGALEQTGVALNVAQLVGHGAVRAAVTGPLRMQAPSGDELAQMERLTRAALDEGCVGVSTGLGYPPGIFAGEAELAAFAGWSASRGKLFTSHLRAYSWASGAYPDDPEATPHNLKAIDEILRVAAAGGARLQISHLIFVGRHTWPRCGEAIQRIERARADGIDVAFDAFPYTAGNTTASVIFPPELLPRLEEFLASPEQMAGLRALGALIFARIGFGLEDIQIMNANAPGLEGYNGLFVGEAAARAGLDVWDFYARLVVESRRNARVLIHKYSGEEGDESALREVLAHPLCTIETDTFVTERGHQNPASYGTFPRVLSTYVEQGLFSFEQAVHKMTGAPAARLGWRDRGWVREGCAADLVVLDGSALRDTASFAEPARFPEGIESVWINGQPVVDGGRYDAGARAGRVLRS